MTDIYPALNDRQREILLRMLDSNWQVDDLERDDPDCVDMDVVKRLIGWKPTEMGTGTIWRLKASGLALARRLKGVS